MTAAAAVLCVVALFVVSVGVSFCAGFFYAFILIQRAGKLEFPAGVQPPHRSPSDHQATSMPSRSARIVDRGPASRES